jgi:NADH-quinone oxidoreductase subunit I
MYGSGIWKTLVVSFKRIAETYLDDLRWGKKRYYTAEGIAHRMSKDARGIFTVQYPEEKVPVPEEFRFVPFLVYDFDEDGHKKYRCTSCGICSKVCPPQCIWIERSTNPKTGRPFPDPAEFYIDIDLCMNCGFCAEFCPFNAIKMDHAYEISVFDRKANNIYDKEKLGKPLSYFASIRPSDVKEEIEAQARAKEEFARAKAEKEKRDMLQKEN